MIGKKSCEKCSGTGRVMNELGFFVKCNCVDELKEVEKNNSELLGAKPIVNVGEAIEDKAVLLGYVPEHRKHDDFDHNRLYSRIKSMCEDKTCGIRKETIATYVNVLNGILGLLRTGKLPKQSYLIGASNGFGKTTFVNTAIKLLLANDKKVVPYKSLYELAILQNDSYKEIMDGKRAMAMRKIYRGDADEVNMETEEESVLDIKASEAKWKDYLDAELVFCYLTGVSEECMWIEMSTLKTLLQLRSNKGLGTIVMMAESLSWYKNNTDIRKYILNEIMESREYAVACLDKLVHVSTYLIDAESVVRAQEGLKD